ncbi:MAG: DUF3054 family protein [Anaerolineales bacterium]|jgi:hypothetical protein
MGTNRSATFIWVLVIGDLVTLGLVTILGFAAHNELDGANPRMLTTFIPLALGWFMSAPFLGAFDTQKLKDWRDLWRPAWAAVLAAPMAAWLRALWLATPVVPVFVAVLGAITLAGLFVWRFLFWLMWSRRSAVYG